MSQPTKPSILLLYGLDETSHGFEIESTLSLVHKATSALIERGWRVAPLQLTHDLVTPLKPYSPHEWLVLNLCEGSPHQAFYYAQVTRCLAKLGYVFTGSDSWSLDETQFKWRMKALMEKGNAATPPWCVVHHGEKISFNHFPAIVGNQSLPSRVLRVMAIHMLKKGLKGLTARFLSWPIM